MNKQKVIDAIKIIQEFLPKTAMKENGLTAPDVGFVVYKLDMVLKTLEKVEETKVDKIEVKCTCGFEGYLEEWFMAANDSGRVLLQCPRCGREEEN